MTMAVSPRNISRTELKRILRDGSIAPLYQPIVELHSGVVVAYEALARGPKGSALEIPGPMFGLAVREGLLEELDRACRVAAFAGARGSSIGQQSALFVNVEPSASVADVPSDFRAALAGGEMRVVFELTERALTARPAEVLQAVDELRSLGAEIALDDVGVDPRSLALMPFLLPEVVKLDMSLIHGVPDANMARTMHAVGAHAQRTGAIVLAEGIETNEHLERALALGATHGQGWRFGRPAPPQRPTSMDGTSSGLPYRETLRPQTSTSTPYELVAASGRSPRVASKQLLLSLSRQLERQAEQMGPECVVLSSLQHDRYLTEETRRRYERLAAQAAFVALLGEGVAHGARTDVRGADLAPGEPLTNEWNVCVVGPHFAAAMVALDLRTSGPDHERKFEYHLTYERGEVTAAAQSMMARITSA